MPALVDTTIRLLSQEPLAARMQTARVLELAALLDRAGFGYLEVSGGGCFDSAVRRGVESPWERIRAIRARCETPLGIALRGRFLVGSRPLSEDLVRRFIASAAESGIDVFRLHDPLNDLGNLREAAAAIREADKELAVGLVYSPGPTAEPDMLLDRAEELEEIAETESQRAREQRTTAERTARQAQAVDPHASDPDDNFDVEKTLRRAPDRKAGDEPPAEEVAG